MRMRKKKHGAERLALCSDFIVSEPKPISGIPVWLEIGAGKGGFACGMCKKNPTVQYFAMERVTDCVVLAAEKAREIKEVFRDWLKMNYKNWTEEDQIYRRY